MNAQLVLSCWAGTPACRICSPLVPTSVCFSSFVTSVGNALGLFASCSASQAGRQLRALHQAFNYEPEEEAPYSDCEPAAAGPSVQHKYVRLCHYVAQEVCSSLRCTDKPALRRGDKELLCACEEEWGFFQRLGLLLKTAHSLHVLWGVAGGLGHMLKAGGPGEGGARVPLGTGLPGIVCRCLEFGVMELNGNAVLIYVRLLSFYKTIAVYEESLLS